MFFSGFHRHMQNGPCKRGGVKATERSVGPVGRGLDAGKRHGSLRAADGTVNFELTIMVVLVIGAVGDYHPLGSLSTCRAAQA
jgi:hypothetical protein